MAISKEKKEELVGQYIDMLEHSNGFAVVAASGMTVTQTENLRKKIYDAGGKYVVTKNTLMRIALQEAGWQVPEEALVGPTAIAFGGDNFPGVAKAIFEFMKDPIFEEKMRVKGGVMGGSDVLNGADVKAVSDLPSLPELQAQIIGLLVTPSRSLVTILNNAESGVVNVLQAWLDKDSDGGEAA